MPGNHGLKRGFTRRIRVPYGAAFYATPLVGELFYRTDLKQLFVFVGLGEPGTTTGWFNLKNAQYSA